jgi:lycopene cyclase domain-containing protein
MEFANFTYLIVLASALSAPLALSFDKKVQYYKKLKYILPAILIMASIFWVWDIKFTASGVWSFNSKYTLGISVAGMPVEEWLFFLVIPYSCVFIYEVLKYYLKTIANAKLFLAFSIFLVVCFSLLSYFFRHQAYTFLTFLLSAIYLGYTLVRNKFKNHFSRFYLAYFVSVIPFLAVNGILTTLPVVEYNTAHILNIRIINIPVEDFSYFFLMFLMVVTIYESLKESKIF